MEIIHAGKNHLTYRAVCEVLADEFDWKSKGLPWNQSFLFKLFVGNDEVGMFNFTTLPGCCGVVVSHGLWLKEQWRAAGHTPYLQELREKVARGLGYGAMIATVITSNFPEVISSANSGWKLGPVFRNTERSGNDVSFQIKVLEKGSS